MEGITDCQICGQYWHVSTGRGTRPLYCPKCKPKILREQAKLRMRKYRAEKSQEPRDDQPVLVVQESAIATQAGLHTERELYDLDSILALLPPSKAAWLKRQITRLDKIS